VKEYNYNYKQQEEASRKKTDMQETAKLTRKTEQKNTNGNMQNLTTCK
jgi:hypothetical protein